MIYIIHEDHSWGGLGEEGGGEGLGDGGGGGMALQLLTSDKMFFFPFL